MRRLGVVVAVAALAAVPAAARPVQDGFELVETITLPATVGLPGLTSKTVFDPETKYRLVVSGVAERNLPPKDPQPSRMSSYDALYCFDGECPGPKPRKTVGVVFVVGGATHDLDDLRQPPGNLPYNAGSPERARIGRTGRWVRKCASTTTCTPAPTATWS